MKSISRVSICIGLVLALGLSACGDDDSTQSSASDPEPDPTDAPESPDDTGDSTEEASGDGCTEDRVGGTLTMGTYAQPRGFDPAASSISGTIGGHEIAGLFDTLFKFNTETLEVEPHVAESLEPNDDATEWTLRLRPDIFFGNGDPLTAEAVRGSISRHIELGASSGSRGLSLVDDMEVVDDLTLLITLREPWGTFPFVLAYDGGMITNPAIVEELGDEEFATNPAGAGVGPYELASFVPGEEIVLTAKDDYWGGPVCIEEIRFVHIPGDLATLDALDLGEIDLGFLRDARVIADARDRGLAGPSAVQHGSNQLEMNLGVAGTTPPTLDERVRQAIVLALDPEFIDERQTEGNGFPTSALVHPSSLLASDVEGPPYDPDQARELLDAAKADGYDGGIRLLTNDPPDRVEASLAIEALLEDVGFEVEREVVPTDELGPRVVVDHDFDLAVFGLSIPEASLWQGLSRMRSDGTQNFSGIDSPEMDAALAELQSAVTIDEQKEALGGIQQVVNDVLATGIWGSVETMIAHDPSVHGLFLNTREIVQFDDAYVE